MNIFKKIALGLVFTGLASSVFAVHPNENKDIEIFEAKKRTKITHSTSFKVVGFFFRGIVFGTLGGAIGGIAFGAFGALTAIPELALAEQSKIQKADKTISFKAAIAQSYKNLFKDKATTKKTLAKAAIIISGHAGVGTLAGAGICATAGAAGLPIALNIIEKIKGE